MDFQDSAIQRLNFWNFQYQKNFTKNVCKGINEIFAETLKEPLNSLDINIDSTTEINNLQFDASSFLDLDLKSSDDDVVNYKGINTSEVL